MSKDGSLIPIGESLENLKSPFKRGFREVLSGLSSNRPIFPFRSGEANNELTVAPSLPARAFPVSADDRIQENHHDA